MSAAWTPREDALLGTDTDAAIGKRLRRPRRAVESRRARLKIPAFVEHRRAWTSDELRLLGKISDAKLAELLGCSRLTVYRKRVALGKRAAHPEHARKSVP